MIQAHLQRQSAQACRAGPRRLHQLLPQVRELRQPAAQHLVHVTPHLRSSVCRVRDFEFQYVQQSVARAQAVMQKWSALRPSSLHAREPVNGCKPSQRGSAVRLAKAFLPDPHIGATAAHRRIATTEPHLHQRQQYQHQQEATPTGGVVRTMRSTTGYWSHRSRYCSSRYVVFAAGHAAQGCAAAGTLLNSAGSASSDSALITPSAPAARRRNIH